MPLTAYDWAARINALRPGQCLKIDARDLADVPGDPVWSTSDRTGFERIKENVIGSAYPDLWDFHVDALSGDLTVYRKPPSNGANNDQ